MLDWSRWPNFSREEMACKHTGRCKISPDLMDALQGLRSQLGVPLYVTSGYRDPSHPVERAKPVPGTHAQGLAADIACDGALAYRILAAAPACGFTGIGVSQKGGERFVHLDIWTGGPRPNVWSY